MAIGGYIKGGSIEAAAEFALTTVELGKMKLGENIWMCFNMYNIIPLCSCFVKYDVLWCTFTWLPVLLVHDFD